MGRDVIAPADGMPDPAFWNARRVLVTGHTGFKGSWLTCWLEQLGAVVLGVSLPEPASTPSMWEQLGDRRTREARHDIAGDGWLEAVHDFDPEVVLHLAAQPLVSVGFAEPTATFAVNVLGTVRVLAAVRELPHVTATVVITTDKVYDPGQAPPHDESHPLGGRDPYSASKAAAELVVAGWPALLSPVATARAGNVIGGGDWAKDRLVPDLVRAWSAGCVPELRHPDAVRPWQHVLEPLRGYLLYAQALAGGAQLPPSLNFGPSSHEPVTVREVVGVAAAEWRRLGGALPEGVWRQGTGRAFTETAELVLDSSLAGKTLGWASLLDWRDAVTLTFEWYARAGTGQPVAELVAEQLKAYVTAVGGRPA